VNIIRPKCRIWVGTLDEQIIAYLAMNGSYIDRLYVDPPEWRKGWGTRFVNLAKQLSPQGIELHTHVENLAARALYERHGFKAVKFGTSPPPESAPDVEYHWRP
jgi:ribosomal protein S18 acetylase RimI-like enzyme